MWAQSMLEYGAMSVLIEAFTNLWVSGREFFLRLNPVWYIVPVVVYLLVRRRR